MQEKKIAEIIVLMIRHDPTVPIDRPIVHKDPACPTPILHNYHNWYDLVLRKEFFLTPRGHEFQFRHWNIYCSNEDLFVYQGKRFEEISIILSSERMYWFLTQTICKSHDPFYSAYKDYKTHRCTCCAGNYFQYYLEEIHKPIPGGPKEIW